MAIEIKVPALGESVTEATVGQWFKQPGDPVAVDEPVVELETDKVTIEVPAPAAGVLAAIKVPQGTTVAVGTVLGAIANAGAQPGPSNEGCQPCQPRRRKPTPPAPWSAPQPAAAQPRAPAAEPAGIDAGAMPPAPAARKIMAEKGLAAADVAGSGRRGQILKEDAIAAVTAQRPRSGSGGSARDHRQLFAGQRTRCRPAAARTVRSERCRARRARAHDAAAPDHCPSAEGGAEHGRHAHHV